MSQRAASPDRDEDRQWRVSRDSGDVRARASLQHQVHELGNRIPGSPVDEGQPLAIAVHRPGRRHRGRPAHPQARTRRHDARGVAVLGRYGHVRAVGHHRGRGRTDRLRGHRDRAGRADGHWDLLRPVHAPVVSRRDAQEPAGDAHRRHDVLVRRHRACRDGLGPRSRRHPGRHGRGVGPPVVRPLPGPVPAPDASRRGGGAGGRRGATRVPGMHRGGRPRRHRVRGWRYLRITDRGARCRASGRACRVVQAVDTRGLARFARRYDCLLVFRHAVGDFVPVGASILEVHGGSPPVAVGRRLTSMVALGVERTVEQDPAFAIRIMVDIASWHCRRPSTPQPRQSRSWTISPRRCD